MEFSMKLKKTPNITKSDENSTNCRNAKKRKKLNNSLCKKCVCSPMKASTFELPAIWKELRMKNQLCDGTVKCTDGEEFKIHRAILAAVSPYFRALFTNSINREPAEATEASISISGDIFKIFLDYAYTGSCIIDSTNVKDLLKFADQYEMLDVVKLCCSYLIEQLCPANCLEIMKFAGQYFCKDLEQRGRLFILHNFSKMLKENEDFYHISAEYLIGLLKDDELNVKSEETVFEAIEMWIKFSPIKRRVFLLDLIKCIRFGIVYPLTLYEFCKEVSNSDLVGDDKECKEYLQEVNDISIGLIQEERLEYYRNYIYRPRIPHAVLFAVGGWSSGSPTNVLETYDSRADRWLFSVDTDLSPRAYHGLCHLNGLIYMIGGFDGNEYFNSIRCFDPLLHKWSDRSCMYYPRCYVSVVIHDGHIFAMGGYNGRTRMNSVEIYDPEKNQWELTTPMQKQRSDASAATLHDKIYIVGGFNGQQVMSSAEVYDTVSKQWTFIPEMISARSGVSLVALGTSLYAMGGFNGYTRLASVEKYDPDSSASWVEISEMLTPRSNFATAVLDDYIYVIGGFNDRFVSGSTTINYVEHYDPDTNDWYDTGSMNISRSALSACVVPGLPNVKDYTVLGRKDIEADM